MHAKIVRHGILTATLATAFTCLAQDPPREGPFGGGGAEARMRAGRAAGGMFRGGGDGLERETMLCRMIAEPRVMEELGMAPEKAESLRSELNKLQERQIDLQAELQKLMLRQTDMVAGLLADRAKTPDETMKLVEEIGKVRTEIAKLTIERVLALRNHLTDEQIAKARAMMSTRLERLRGGGEGAMRPEGRRREGDAPRMREGGMREGGGDAPRGAWERGRGREGAAPRRDRNP
jgi:hypothetical protein